MSLSRRQARQITDSAYLAASTALLWAALYYLPVGGPLFRLALPLPLALPVAVQIKLDLQGTGRFALVPAAALDKSANHRESPR